MSDLVGNIKTILEKLKNHNRSYSQLKSDIFDNDNVQLIVETSGIAKTLYKSYKFGSMLKFRAFLNGFSMNEDPTQAQLEKLEKYISVDDEKVEFISNFFSNILLSNSSKACVIMGTILKDIVDKESVVKHEDLIAINALKEFYDVDIVNFNIIESVFIDKSEEKIGLTDILFKIKHNDLDDLSVLMTLDKAAATQLLFVTTSVDMSTDVNKFENRRKEADNFYVMTSGGKVLTKYINRISEL
ncbi:hypothetical protein [Bacillus pumilus]|uniref:hypothetical protein n=2 Tax=Bacillus pumilus TaxID=1408 RepID=UPI00227F92DA|nr:hypothetical protein [Bacillus pumilus]MCY7505140.1 hypothetical protein [Bacillus pumilus]MED4725717.1 hypothetical protein [Bacillus pumilus]